MIYHSLTPLNYNFDSIPDGYGKDLSSISFFKLL